MIKEKEDTESVYLEPVKKEKGEVYTLVTREYMADGHDGFLPLKSCHRVIDEECGSLMSSIVRKYFLGKLVLKGFSAAAYPFQVPISSTKWLASKLTPRRSTPRPRLLLNTACMRMIAGPGLCGRTQSTRSFSSSAAKRTTAIS
jgi:hypothetical protein